MVEKKGSKVDDLGRNCYAWPGRAVGVDDLKPRDGFEQWDSLFLPQNLWFNSLALPSHSVVVTPRSLSHPEVFSTIS